ncbi:MAG: NAD(P)-dependent glycerol-3-phosphate dehydrogenase [Candidatus Syntrophosphaera sp.]|nr:NAD(P)-dependent glycerol-3-phosphate dehydrogenase [Candidatus Syntrophosphaera sp.]
MRIAIIGGGGWGLALAKLLSENSHQILVWEHDTRFLDSLLETRSNPLLLPSVQLPEGIGFTGSFADIAQFSPRIVILATPSQFLRATLQSIPPTDQDRIWLDPELLAVVNVSKGIETGSLKTMSEVLQEILPPQVQNRICALSGPSHAEEVARRIPTTVVVAGTDDELLQTLQNVFSNSYFRVYRSLDLAGVEMGGAVKNVIAIAAGIVAGLGFGDNTMGALLTRGLVEIQRLGMACGARAETFLGLSGLGDLVTTAISQHSRNRYVGFEIGSGRKLRDIVAEMSMVAEGAVTTLSVYQLARQKGIEMPITGQVYAVLYEDKDPRQAIIELMTRELKAE